jgi:poly(A) polymerase
VTRFLANFQLVREKLKEIEEKDAVRNFQPPVTGELIMEIFGLTPCKEIGLIKSAIKEAILDGEISNNYDEAYTFMLEKGKELGLVQVKGQNNEL